MPKGLITEIQVVETYPAPEYNLSDQDIEQFREELDSYVKLFESALLRFESRAWYGIAKPKS